MSERVAIEMGQSDVGGRLDVLVAAHLPDVSRSMAHELIDRGKVKVNGDSAKPSYRVRIGDRVEVDDYRPPSLSAAPEEIPLKVVYQDPDIVVIDKPAGLVVHPAKGHYSGTIANALAAMYPQTRELGSEERPGIVHRLDKDTSGLMVVALTPAALASLQRQIASRTAGRRYLALATGRVEPSEGTIEAPIGRDRSNPQRMAVHGLAAKPAQTNFRVIEYLPGFSLVEAALRTGRTHQIRVHLAAIGHPIAGDRQYGGARLAKLGRQFLHAYRLSLDSPSTGESLTFESDLPEDLQLILTELRSMRIQAESIAT